MGANFRRATFEDLATFARATFQVQAQFLWATFQSDAAFDQATFKGGAAFGDATFQSGALFGSAIFEASALFDWATFQSDAWFQEATFHDDAQFYRATFGGDTSFDGATFGGEAGFGGARFEQARQLGPLFAYSVFWLDGAYFAQPIQIEASTGALSCQRARFPAGVQFRLRGAHIVLDDADLSSPSLLEGIAAVSNSELARREQGLVQAVRPIAPKAVLEPSARPRLLSVQGANVAGLTVSNVDLAECRFAGAHNLDRLRLETKVTFSAAPVRLRGIGAR